MSKRRNRVFPYSVRVEAPSVLEEQLRLFTSNCSPTPSPEVLGSVQQSFSKRDKLAALLTGELNFHDEGTSYASHDLHADG